MSQIVSDELGLSFQLKDSDKPVLRGKECMYTSISTINSIASFINTSFGPMGMDKILLSQDDALTVTNDGATILQEMDMTTNPVSRLVVQLSESQDDEVGDGTTSVVLLASAMLTQAKRLLEKGIHPIKIAEGFGHALDLAVEHFNSISEEVADLSAYMLKAAKTSLGSKIVSLFDFSDICVEAVLHTADLERNDLDMELIHIISKPGKNLSDTKLFKGIVLQKEFSHVQMTKEVKNAKIALLSCPFEIPRLKNKNSVMIRNSQEFSNLEKYERETFVSMIDKLKECKVDVVMCQWGFDDEANSLLMENRMPAVRWVGGHELGLIAPHINGSIIARFEDLKPEHLGVANIREQSLGTDSDKIIFVESATNKKGCTILVRGSTDFVVEEAKRSIRDALCAVRNIMSNRRIIYGGGSCELSASIFLEKKSKEYKGETEEAIRAFSESLLEIPILLARNSGFDPLCYVEKLREIQITTNDNTIGVDCLEMNEKSMKKNGIFESLKSKTRQLEMATDLVCSILKINEVVRIDDE